MQSLTEFSQHFVQPAKGHLFDFLSHKKKQIKAPLFYREKYLQLLDLIITERKIT